MKERMQKTLAEVKGCPQKDRTESEGYVGVQTFMWICEDNIVEVPFDKEHLLERIISPDNLLKAHKAVQRNRGCSGIDKMSCEQMLPWLLANKDALIRSLLDGSYRPNPVKRVEIPKDNGNMRLLGILTVIDRLVQQAINQTLTPIYERQFSPRSYGFRPSRGCHNALRGAQKIIDDGYIYVVDLDLERFFDTVSHSKLIEILNRTIKDGRVISLSVLCARCEIPWLLLSCNERQMPTHVTPKSQIQDESQTQEVDFPKQWLGICQEEAKT